jgi:hypothetical protein
MATNESTAPSEFTTNVPVAAPITPPSTSIKYNPQPRNGHEQHKLRAVITILCHSPSAAAPQLSAP